MMMSLFGLNQIDFLVYGRLSKTKGSVGRQNKNNIKTQKKNSPFIIYNNDKCFLVLAIYISLLCFLSYFLIKKQKTIA